MAETFEEQIAAILQGTEFSSSQEQDATTAGEAQRIIHVEQYTLPNGDVLFRLPTGEGVLISGEVINKLDKNAVESTLDSATPLTDAEIKQFEVSHTPTLPLTTEQEAAPATPPPPFRCDRQMP